jgi:hypothetical protein
MEYAVILHNYEKNTRTIPEFVSSYDNFKELLKINYQKVRHIENISLSNLRKGSEYPCNEKYIIYNKNEMLATLYIKKKKDNPLLQWKHHYELEIISKWELARFELKEKQTFEKTKSHSHNQITNFKITGLSQGSMFIIYKHLSFIDKFHLFLNRVEDRITDFTKKEFNKIIITNNTNFVKELECLDNCIICDKYSSEIIDDKRNNNNIIIVDVNCISEDNIAHFIDLINDFEPNKMCIIVLVNEDSHFLKYLSLAEHIMVTKDVSDNALKLVFKQNKLRDLETFYKFSLCVKQVMDQVGQIVITRGNKDMKWL